MRPSTASNPVTRLERAECVRLVRDRYIGRVGYLDGGRPVIVPVNYRLTPDGEVAVLTSSGAKRDAAEAGSVMSLQVDEVDLEYHSSWSVLISGKSRLIDDPEEAERQARQLRLRPWVGSDERTHLILIQPDRVEGRRHR